MSENLNGVDKKANIIKNNYVYMLRCNDNSLYTGWTNDIEKRINAHQLGKGAKYTKARLPVNLVYLEILPSKNEAMKREYEIKQLTKDKKELLIIGEMNQLFLVNLK